MVEKRFRDRGGLMEGWKQSDTVNIQMSWSCCKNTDRMRKIKKNCKRDGKQTQ